MDSTPKSENEGETGTQDDSILHSQWSPTNSQDSVFSASPGDNSPHIPPKKPKEVIRNEFSQISRPRSDCGDQNLSQNYSDSEDNSYMADGSDISFTPEIARRINLDDIIESSTSEEEETDYETKARKKKLEILNDTFYAKLKQFFEAAFALLVYKKILQPRTKFVLKSQFGVDVPVFCDRASREYVREISNKMVFFMRKGVLDGAVFHVMIENSHGIPTTIQRIVFRPNGYFYPATCDILKDTEVKEVMDQTISQLSKILREIDDSDLEELKYPWFSQWSISIGLKKEFVEMFKGSEYGHMGPFIGDPNAHYFPWKKRPRFSQALKLGLLAKRNRNQIGLATELSKKLIKLNRMRKKKSPSPTSAQTSPRSLRTPKRRIYKKTNLSDAELEQKSQEKLPQWEFLSSSDDEDIAPLKLKDNNKFCVDPISSFPIVSDLMILIYKIDYPSKFVVDEAMIQEANDEPEKQLLQYNMTSVIT